MRIYKYFHSCILLDDGRTKILIDPGDYCFIEGRAKAEEFTGISAILLTHEHRDHVDIAALKTILKNNNAKIFSNSGVKNSLEKENIQVSVIGSEEITIDGFTLRALPAKHEKAFKEPPENTAFLINNTFLHPGDSLDKSLYAFSPIKVLAVPILASWGKIREMVEFAKELKPEIVIPIHDGLVKEELIGELYGFTRGYFEEMGAVFNPLIDSKDFLEI